MYIVIVACLDTHEVIPRFSNRKRDIFGRFKGLGGLVPGEGYCINTTQRIPVSWGSLNVFDVAMDDYCRNAQPF